MSSLPVHTERDCPHGCKLDARPHTHYEPIIGWYNNRPITEFCSMCEEQFEPLASDSMWVCARCLSRIAHMSSEEKAYLVSLFKGDATL